MSGLAEVKSYQEEELQEEREEGGMQEINCGVLSQVLRKDRSHELTLC